MEDERYRYQFIVNGEIKDQVTEESKLDLIKDILEMKWEEKDDLFGIKLKDNLIKYLKEV